MRSFSRFTDLPAPDLTDEMRARLGFLESLARGQSFAVVGEGGTGKTTLLRLAIEPDVMRRFDVDPEQLLIAGVAGDDILGRDPDGFWRDLILPQLAKAAAKLGLSELAAEIPGLPEKMRSVRLGVEEALYRIRSERKRVLMVWDDFDWILENPALDSFFFNHLRSRNMEGEVTYLIASERSLDAFEISSAHASPFFNIFAKITLGRPMYSR